MKNFDKVKLVKHLCTVAAIIGMAVTLGSNWVSEKETKANIEKLVDERLKK